MLLNSEPTAVSSWIEDVRARAVPLWTRTIDDSELSSALDPDEPHTLRWMGLLGGADELLDRLAATGDQRALAVLTASTAVSPALEIEPWVETFRDVVVSALLEVDSLPLTACPSHDRATAFRELIEPIVDRADEDLAKGLPAIGRFRPEARGALRTCLLEQLSFLSANALGLDWYEYRFERCPAAGFEEAFAALPETWALYDQFVCDTRGIGMLRVFDEYPVLARLVSTVTGHWIANMRELAVRLDEDVAVLQERLGGHHESGELDVLDVIWNLSDPHRGGQFVLELKFGNGHRAVYKPRGCDGEQIWIAAAEWLNERVPESLAITAAWVIDRGDYHWAEFISNEPCSAPEGLHRYYARLGATVALMETLAGTDVHFENLIASGENPVVVDLEMLLNPGPDGSDTLARTGILPSWEVGPGGRQYDLSVLGADASQTQEFAVWVWENIGSDQMVRVRRPAEALAQRHIAADLRGPSVPSDYVEELADGYKAAYSAISVDLESMVTNPPLAELLRQPDLRVLLRSTEDYARVATHLLQPRLLRDGIDRSIELEVLSTPLTFTGGSRKARAWIFTTERLALEDFDIPHFTTTEWAGLPGLGDEPDLARIGLERNAQLLRAARAHRSEAQMLSNVAAMRRSIADRFGDERIR